MQKRADRVVGVTRNAERAIVIGRQRAGVRANRDRDRRGVGQPAIVRHRVGEAVGSAVASRRGIPERAVGLHRNRAMHRLRRDREGHRAVLRIAVVGGDSAVEHRLIRRREGIVHRVRRHIDGENVDRNSGRIHAAIAIADSVDEGIRPHIARIRDVGE